MDAAVEETIGAALVAVAAAAAQAHRQGPTFHETLLTALANLEEELEAASCLAAPHNPRQDTMRLGSVRTPLLALLLPLAEAPSTATTADREGLPARVRETALRCVGATLAVESPATAQEVASLLMRLTIVGAGGLPTGEPGDAMQQGAANAAIGQTEELIGAALAAITALVSHDCPAVVGALSDPKLLPALAHTVTVALTAAGATESAAPSAAVRIDCVFFFFRLTMICCFHVCLVCGVAMTLCDLIRFC